MKSQFKKYLIITALSLLFSLAIIRWHSQGNVPFCYKSAGCSASQTLRGEVTTTEYGYPSTYRQVERFEPENTNERSGGYAGFAEAQVEAKSTSIPLIISNFIFWFALLYLLSKMYRKLRPARTLAPKSEVPPAEAASSPPANEKR